MIDYLIILALANSPSVVVVTDRDDFPYHQHHSVNKNGSADKNLILLNHQVPPLLTKHDLKFQKGCPKKICCHFTRSKVTKLRHEVHKNFRVHNCWWRCKMCEFKVHKIWLWLRRVEITAVSKRENSWEKSLKRDVKTLLLILVSCKYVFGTVFVYWFCYKSPWFNVNSVCKLASVAAQHGQRVHSGLRAHVLFCGKNALWLRRSSVCRYWPHWWTSAFNLIIF